MYSLYLNYNFVLDPINGNSQLLIGILISSYF